MARALFPFVNVGDGSGKAEELWNQDCVIRMIDVPACKERNPLSVLIIISAHLDFHFVEGTGLPLTCLTCGIESNPVGGSFTAGKGDGGRVLSLLGWSWDLEQRAGVEVAGGKAWFSRV